MNKLNCINIEYSNTSSEEEVLDFYQDLSTIYAVPMMEPIKSESDMPHLGVSEIMITLFVAPIITFGIEYGLNSLISYFKSKKNDKKTFQVVLKMDIDDVAPRILKISLDEKTLEKDLSILKNQFDKKAAKLIQQRNTFKEQLFTLVGKDETESALELVLSHIKAYNNEDKLQWEKILIIQLAKISTLKKNTMAGIITLEEINIIKSQVNSTIIDLINDMVK